MAHSSASVSWVLLCVARDDGDRCPGLGEAKRHGLAHAPIAAGDDCDVTPQRELVENRHHENL
jgi:hypothetical protein